MKYLDTQNGWHAFNLGTGHGYSVLEMIKAFEKVCGNPVPFKIMSRRLGDVANCFAQVDKAKRSLSWQAEFGLHQMCEDAWRWQQNKA